VKFEASSDPPKASVHFNNVQPEENSFMKIVNKFDKHKQKR